MRRLCGILFLSLMAFTALAQSYPSSGLIRAQATFAVGKDVWLQGAKPYLHTELEVMPDDNIGLAGTILVQLARNGEAKPINALFSSDVATHHLFFGPVWHFRPHQPFDVHAGLQAGFTAAQQWRTSSWLGYPDNILEVAPSAAGTIGVAYYGSFFHVFAQGKIITGYHSGEYHRGPLTEGMISAGLGWNIDVKK